MQTIFRGAVMLATLAALGYAAVEYGPPEVVQPVARRLIELADEALGAQHPADGQSAVRPPLPVASAPTARPTPPARLRAPTPTLPGDGSEGSLRAGATGRLSAPPLAGQRAGGDRLSADAVPPSTAGPDVQLTRWLGELSSLGVKTHAVEQWGPTGAYHRVTCEVPLVDSSSATRHFEAIRDSPAAAAQQVASQVQVWQSERLGRVTGELTRR